MRMAARRKKVAEMRLAGYTLKEMAKELGVASSTIINDVRAIKADADLVQLEKSLITKNEDLVLAVSPEDDSPIRRAAIEAALNQDKTVNQIAKETGATIREVTQWVNEALAEIGDYAGRTLDEWRTQDMIIIDRQISQLVESSAQEPVPDLDEDGNQIGWRISPSRAAQIRAQASKVLLETMHFRAKMLGLYQQKQEVEITRNAVVRIRGVDISAFPQAHDVIDGEFSDAN